MNKMIVLLALACLCGSPMFAQSVVLKLKNDSEVNTSVSAISNAALFTKNGSFSFVDIASATFENKVQKDQTMYDRLQAAGVSVQFSGQPIVIDSVNSKATNKEEVNIDQIVDALDRFRQERQTGKTLQILGPLITVAGSVLYAADTKNKDIAVGLMAGGAVISLIGLGIDIGAGKHLHLRSK